MDEMKTRTDLLNDFLDYLKTLEKTKTKQAKQDFLYFIINVQEDDGLDNLDKIKKHLEG